MESGKRKKSTQSGSATPKVAKATEVKHKHGEPLATDAGGSLSNDEVATGLTPSTPEPPIASAVSKSPEPPSLQSQKQAEDRALVRRAREGDQRAFAEIAKRHKHGIERMIRPLVRSAPTDELEDLVQEALTKAFLHIHSYSEEYAFSTWLYRIATNHAIDYLRRRKLNAFSISAPPTQSTHKSDDEPREYEIADTSWVPEELMVSDERTRLIEEAIEKLPDNYRKVIRLRHSDDLEYEEIAKVLKIPMGTVKVHLHRARALLARMLEGRI